MYNNKAVWAVYNLEKYIYLTNFPIHQPMLLTIGFARNPSNQSIGQITERVTVIFWLRLTIVNLVFIKNETKQSKAIMVMLFFPPVNNRTSEYDYKVLSLFTPRRIQCIQANNIQIVYLTIIYIAYISSRNIKTELKKAEMCVHLQTV